MELSFRRVAGRFVLAAGVCAAAILAVRGDDQTPDQVTFVVDPRPVGAALRHVEVTIATADEILGSLETRDGAHDRIRPLRLVTPTPRGEVTITLDVLTAGGVHRVVHRARPAAGATVEIVLGAPTTE